MQVQIAKILDGVPKVTNSLEKRVDEIPKDYQQQIIDGIGSILEDFDTNTYVEGDDSWRRIPAKDRVKKRLDYVLKM